MSGQEPVVHIQADLVSVVEWAERMRVQWVFSDKVETQAPITPNL